MGTLERTSRLTGTAILAALVIVFDYTLKFSGLKIPFPWMPFLKFDFTGVPIVIALLLFDLQSSLSVSFIAGLGILARSGDFIGASMKVLAEATTVVGIFLGEKFVFPGKEKKGIKFIPFLIGLVLRIIVMMIANLIVLPNAYGIPWSGVIGMIPMLGVFNAIQGAISIFLGNFLNEAYKLRIPN
jgi:riboflavin transporter FmnP